MKKLIFMFLLLSFMFSCKQQKETTQPKSTSSYHEENNSSDREKKKLKKVRSDRDIMDDYVGTFVSDGFPNSFYKSIVITKQSVGVLGLTIESHNAEDDSMCSFQAEGTVGLGKLLVPIEWRGFRVIYTLELDGKDNLKFYTMAEKNKHSLKSYCNNNISLFGSYRRPKS